MTNFPYKLGFIGAGNMAEAITRAAMEHDVLDASQLFAADIVDARRQVFADLGVAVTDDAAQLILQCEQIMLAIKPQQAATLAPLLAEHLDCGQQVLISIMAGISTAKLASLMDKKPQQMRIIRVMPNTPLMVGLGMSGLAMGEGCQATDEALAMQLFAAGQSEAILVEESQLDAITAISGSGPAYLFYLAEAMQQAAAVMGLDEHKRLLVDQTLVGAGALLQQSADTAAQLRQKVMSPGGTTEAAIGHMEERQVRESIVNALKAAEQRSRELGQ